MATGRVNIHAHWDGRRVDQGLERLQNDMGRFRNNSRLVNRTVSAIGPTMVAAFTGAGAIAIADRMLDMARLADQVRLTTGAFDAQARKWGSTGPQELEKLSAAVGRTLSDLDLMARVGAGVDAGLTFTQSRTAVEFLRRYSLAFQKDFSQLTQTIFTGLSRGSVLMLDDAGIIIDTSSDIFDGLNEVEKKAALVGEAIRLMGEKMGNLPPIESNIITETDRMTSAVENLNTAVGQIFSGDTASLAASITTLIDAATDAIKGVGIQPTPAGAPPGSELLNSELRAAHEQVLRTGLTNEEAQILKGAAAAARATGRDPEAEDRRAFMLVLQERAEMMRFIANFGQPKPISEGTFRGYESPFSQTTPQRAAIEKAVREEIALARARSDAATETRLAREAERRTFRTRQEERDDLKASIAAADPGPLPIWIQRANQEESADAGMTPDEIREIDEAFAEMVGGATEGTSTFTQDLDLLAVSMSRLHPEAGAFLSNVNTVVQGVQTITSATSTLGMAGGALTLISGAVSLFQGIFGQSAQDRAALESQRRAREQYRIQQEKLNASIEDAISLTGRFARSLDAMGDSQVRSRISSNIDALNQMLGYQGLTPDNVIQESERIRKLITDKYTFNGEFDERFSYLYRYLNESVTAARIIEQRKADAEIESREEQAKIIIEAIERQREQVLQALINAEEAQRAATLRAVGAQFDYLEAELRARYQPQLQSVAGDDAATLVLRERVFADIERLRSRETEAGTQALNAVSQDFAARRDSANVFYDGIIEAVRTATEDLSVPFDQAITKHTSAFLEKWSEGISLTESTLSRLSPDMQDFVSGFLNGIKSLATFDPNILGGLQKGIPITPPEGGLPGSIPITPPEGGLPGTFNVVLPEGGLPTSIPVVLPEGGLPTSIPVVLPEGGLPLGTGTPGDGFTAGNVPGNVVPFPTEQINNISTRMDRLLTIAEVDIVGQAGFNLSTIKPALTGEGSIKAYTAELAGFTLHAKSVREKLGTIATNTDKPARIYNVDVAVSVTVEKSDLTNIDSDEQAFLSGFISERVQEEISENTELARATGTGG